MSLYNTPLLRHTHIHSVQSFTTPYPPGIGIRCAGASAWERPWGLMRGWECVCLCGVCVCECVYPFSPGVYLVPVRVCHLSTLSLLLWWFAIFFFQYSQLSSTVSKTSNGWLSGNNKDNSGCMCCKLPLNGDGLFFGSHCGPTRPAVNAQLLNRKDRKAWSVLHHPTMKLLSIKRSKNRECY